MSISTLIERGHKSPYRLLSMGSTVGQRVRIARKRRGWSTYELAAALTQAGHSCSQSAIVQLEKKAKGGSKYLSTIARLTGVRFAWIEREDGPMLASDAEMLDGATTEERRILAATLEALRGSRPK